ncbi:hypothetical protein LIER_07543 [Lithospermum erythrorhizon]|uniref:Uncharacterized protein n=1 Tax=Lithospermum erythrorhizon TaxID=34254 RepID=A0AAV3PAA1_LITER
MLTMTVEDVHRVYNLPIGPELIELSSAMDEGCRLSFNELEVDPDRKGYKENISLKAFYDKLRTFKSKTTWRKAVIFCIIVNFMDKVNGVDAINPGPTSTNWTKKELFTRLKNIENGCGFSRAIGESHKDTNKVEHQEECSSGGDQVVLPINPEACDHL